MVLTFGVGTAAAQQTATRPNTTPPMKQTFDKLINVSVAAILCFAFIVLEFNKGTELLHHLEKSLPYHKL
jgi:hypothetical protein